MAKLTSLKILRLHDLKVLADEGDLFRGNAHRGAELGLAAVVLLELVERGVDLGIGGRVDDAQGLLGQQHTADDVVARGLAELGVALAAGHIAGPLGVRLDLRELGVEHGVIDGAVVDDQRHGVRICSGRPF